MLHVLDYFETALKYFLILMIALIVALTFYGVIMRYVFLRPPAWAMEIGRFAFLWLVMLGAVVITRQRAHINIMFFVDKLSSPWRFVWLRVLDLAMLAFCWLLVEQGLTILPLVSEAKSPTLGWSMGWLYFPVPLGGGLMGLYLIEQIVRSVAAKEWRDPVQGGK